MTNVVSWQIFDFKTPINFSVLQEISSIVKGRIYTASQSDKFQIIDTIINFLLHLHVQNALCDTYQIRLFTLTEYIEYADTQ